MVVRQPEILPFPCAMENTSSGSMPMTFWLPIRLLGKWKRANCLGVREHFCLQSLEDFCTELSVRNLCRLSYGKICLPSNGCLTSWGKIFICKQQLGSSVES